MKIKYLSIIAVVALMVTACDNKKPEPVQEPVQEETHLSDKYAQYTLTTNIDHLSDSEKQMLPLLFEAADIMDGLFWRVDLSGIEQLLTTSYQVDYPT